MRRPRISHTLCGDWRDKSNLNIYVVGGLENCQPSHSCLRISLHKNTVHDIAPLPENVTFTKPATICLDGFIYVFDTHSVIQQVIRMDIANEHWESWVFKCEGDFVIPRSLRSYVFRKDHDELI